MENPPDGPVFIVLAFIVLLACVVLGLMGVFQIGV